ncbi:MAG: methionyl-tRNA formyltransferase [Armatimonadota bacterium]
MDVIFMGTPVWASFYLDAIINAGGRIPLVITQPDRPRGRSRTPKPPPVKQKALEMGLEVHQPENINTPESLARLQQAEPDLFVVVAFGQILGDEILEVPAVDALNVHYSLLPELRGPAPVQYALMRGYDKTGVTLQKMASEVDAGDIYAQREVRIEDDDNADTLCRKLTGLGVQMLKETLPKIHAGQLQPTPQDHGETTYAPMITKADRALDFSRPAEDIRNRIRALAPRPAAYCFVSGRRLKVIEAEVGKKFTEVEGKPGEIVEMDNSRGPEIKTGRGTLVLTRVQPAGSREMDAVDWLRGARLQPGVMLSGCVDK